MSLSHRIQRPLDHLVLPVVDLATARLRLSALGFSVAPDARHPFGTENACVYFTDATYLEPLGIADLQIYENHVRQGAEFVSRDRAFRFRVGEDGLSAVVFKSENAEADHASFADAGIAAGDLFSFTRKFQRDDGSEAEAGFRLAFAADLRAPDLFFFTCERLAALSPPDDLLAHQNGVTGIATVLIGEDNPMEFEALLQQLSNCHDIDIHPHGVTVEGAGAGLSIFTHEALSARYGIAPVATGRGLVGRGIVFETVDLANTGDILRQNDIIHETADDMIRVPPASGQGVTFIFKEA
ncbi:UNVERIFIED_ORG: glyoxalase-like protein [Martelella mediterranea]